MSDNLIAIRELGPGELDVLDAVFAGLSPQSRYRRFHSPVPRLTSAVREGLAAVDGTRHLAVAAFRGAEPVGIARLVGLGAGRAELAVEVVDAWQGRGVGGTLVRAVVDLGRAAGVTGIVAEVLAENVPMQMVLFSLFSNLTWVEEGAEIRFSADLPTDSPVRRIA